MRLPRRLVVMGCVAVLAGGAAWLWHWRESHAAPAPLIGMVRTSEVHLAPEISGRLAQFLVHAGERVTADQPVAVLRNPELWAAVGAARAQVDKARSDRDRVYAGVREERVQELAREVEKAKAVHAQAVIELGRKTVLAARADSSQQDLDVAKADEARDRAEIAVAEAKYAEAQRGPTAEERALADATVAAAEAARDVVEARAAKMLIRAPVAGTVAILVSEPGEAVVPGQTVLTLVPDNGLWFGFDVREDRLKSLTIGAKVPVRAAEGTGPIPARVVELRDWGEFAVWRAARAAGDHDLNTFFVRLDPVGTVSGLVPGQTVRVTPGAGGS